MQLWENGAPFYDAAFNNAENQNTSTMDLYLLDQPSGSERGMVLVCPGGGYAMRAEHEGKVIAEYLNQNGFHAAVLNYRVAPYRYPAAFLDARRAIRTLRFYAKDWGIDPQKIAVMGFSAGGHLAGYLSSAFADEMPGETSDAIDALSARPNLSILCYPVITSGPYTHEGSMQMLLGENPDPKLRKQMSVDQRVSQNTPPTFLWHTSDDGAVPVENSLLMAQALRKANVPFTLHIFEHGAHGLGLGLDSECKSWGGLVTDWLKKYSF